MLTIPGLPKSYYGGKEASGVYQNIINQIPPHKVYVEPFLGRGTILRYKRLAEGHNIVCELDEELVNIWVAAINSQNLPIIIYQSSGIDIINELGRNKNLLPREVYIYADPPYLIETRRTPRTRYKYDFTLANHINFLNAAIQSPFNMAISSYHNDLYEEKLQGWRKIEFKAQTRRYTAIEVLYMNYPEPTELHDYSYLGKDFRERERIRKKLNRHVEGLKRLPVFERKAIIEAITNIQ